ncbi:response regulator [Candidatus Gracilibacteria bacterium]|nr:response regulator [Candidatus Gracilibacteria bacterium]
MKILIVEDNKILSNNIAKYLELESIKSKQLFSGVGVNLELKTNSYDLVIMDLGLGEDDGIDIINKIRNASLNIPILILTARDTIKDKISGFNSGADDYLTKPFDYEELLLRINALVRRNFTTKNEVLEFGNIKIDRNTKTVSINLKEIHLSKLEYDLLNYLINYKGKVISKKELLEKVWGEYDDFYPSRTVDIYVGYLRKKLGKQFIETIRGEGYIIQK